MLITEITGNTFDITMMMMSYILNFKETNFYGIYLHDSAIKTRN